MHTPCSLSRPILIIPPLAKICCVGTTVIVLASVFAASAAGHPDWRVNGKYLASGAEKLDRSVGRLTYAEGGHLWTCSAEDFGAIIGPFTDSVITITFTNCNQSAPESCPATFTAEGLAWASKLTGVGQEDIIEDVTIKITTTCPGHSPVVQTINGDVVTAWNSMLQEFTLPETPFEGSTLETEGEPGVLSGDDEVELEQGGTIEVGEETEKEEKEERERVERQEKAGPHWNVGGTRLVAGKTHNFAARAAKPFVLKNALGTDKVECSGLSTQEGVLLGTNPVNPGKSSVVLVYSGCVNAAGSNGSACHLAPSEGSSETATTIRTEPLRSEQVESVVSGSKGDQLLEEVFPAKGSVFATLFFGGECTVLSTKVTGQVVGEPVLDSANGGAIELGGSLPERASWLIRFPATPITEVWLISEGTGKIRKTEQTAFGEKSIETGTELVLLASTKYAPETSAVWSPLP
jgi:hypothetical protein